MQIAEKHLTFYPDSTASWLVTRCFYNPCKSAFLVNAQLMRFREKNFCRVPKKNLKKPFCTTFAQNPKNAPCVFGSKRRVF